MPCTNITWLINRDILIFYDKRAKKFIKYQYTIITIIDQSKEKSNPLKIVYSNFTQTLSFAKTNVR